MVELPRPAKAMSATTNGTTPHLLHFCGGRLALAAAPLLLLLPLPLAAAGRHTAHPAAHAAKHAAAHPAKHAAAAPARHVAAARHHASAQPAHTAAKSKRVNREIAAAEASSRTKLAKHSGKAVAQTTPAKATRQNKTTRQDAEASADRATQDRIRTWYKAQGRADPAEGDTAKKSKAATKPVAAIKAAPAAKPALSEAKPALAEAQPDLSPVPRKATVADFDRALARQTETQRSTALQNQSRTSAADDAADADAVDAGHIPRTAPTARIAAPFTHGELLTATAVRPETRTEIRNEARTDDAALAHTPDTIGTASPAAIRIIAAQQAAAPTPRLQLPKPAPIVRIAPASAAIASAARKPKLDSAVLAGMTADTFDDDAPPTAATAATLANHAQVKTTAADDTDDDASTHHAVPGILPTMYDVRGHLRLLPAMKGTHEILVHQNQMAIADGLDRIDDDAQLQDMRRLKLITALPDTDAISPDDRLPANRRYARPWAVRFLNDLARAHYARFHSALVITSAVRTVEFQKRLIRTNGNAAPPTGDVASPHLYGQAIDLGKHGMGMTEVAWMRAYLTPIEAEGKIDVEEEFQQACFHISIYRRYLGLPARKNTPAPEPVSARPLLQAKAVPAKHRRIPIAILAAGLR